MYINDTFDYLFRDYGDARTRQDPEKLTSEKLTSEKLTSEKLTVPAMLARMAAPRYSGAMTPDEIKAVRRKLNLSQRDLASILRMGQNGERQVRRWEDGEVPVSGPASVAIEALLSGWRPA